VRGYGYQTLGPGTKLAVASAELQQAVYEDWYVGVFFDAGNAADSFDHYSDIKKSTGAGLIYMSPVGPIELSIARAIADPSNKPLHFQLSMGPDL
jgi:translocation and assembly module TamA